MMHVDNLLILTVHTYIKKEKQIFSAYWKHKIKIHWSLTSDLMTEILEEMHLGAISKDTLVQIFI